MKLGGRIWKSRKDKFWLAEVPLLQVTTQGTTQKELLEMVKDAIELLVDDPAFSIDVTLIGNSLFIESNDPKKLIGLILKRQRHRKKLKLEDVAALLGAKSLNEYAQYEQGKHLPSLEKFEKLLQAINPELMPFVSCK